MDSYENFNHFIPPEARKNEDTRHFAPRHGDYGDLIKPPHAHSGRHHLSSRDPNERVSNENRETPKDFFGITEIKESDDRVTLKISDPRNVQKLLGTNSRGEKIPSGLNSGNIGLDRLRLVGGPIKSRMTIERSETSLSGKHMRFPNVIIEVDHLPEFNGNKEEWWVELFTDIQDAKEILELAEKGTKIYESVRRKA